MKKIFGLSIIQLLFILSSSAQVWLHYDTTNSGISDNSITGIAIDASGNKWFGTLNHGVVKFDGTNWTNYYPLPGPPYIKTIATEGDTVWAGGVSGLARYVGGTWTVFNSSNSGLPCNEIEAFAIDKFGNKWIGTTAGLYGGGLTKFDNFNWYSFNQSNSGITITIVGAIGIDSLTNDVWLGSHPLDYMAVQRGLIKFDGSNWMVYDSTNSGMFDYDHIGTLTFDTDHNLWIGTYNQGIIKYDGATWLVFDTTNTPALQGYYNAFAVFVDPLNVKWIAGIGKFVTYNDTGWTVYDSTNSPLPWNIKATKVCFESSNMVWIATSLYGLYVYDLVSSIQMLEEDFSELQVYPNPFHTCTSIEKKISGNISFILYNASGLEVRKLLLQDDLVTFFKENLSAGIYYYSAYKTNHKIAQGKLIIF